MSNRFSRYVNRERELFIPFITAGDPSSEVTIELALHLQKAGASAIELGIPYSDPLADGPVIQSAANRALKAGMSLEKAIMIVADMRKKGLKIPVIIFTYYNLLLQLGRENFFALMNENDVDGLLVPDLPFEESAELRHQCESEQITYISLVAPTTSDERLRTIATNAKGFLYCVSSLGVTGERQAFHPSVYAFLDKVNRFSSVPVVVGFGISKREQIEELKSHCNGVVIGSAIVKQIGSRAAHLLDSELQQSAIDDIYQYVLSLFGRELVN